MYIYDNHVTIAASRSINPFELVTLVTSQCYSDKPFELQVWRERPREKRELLDVYGVDSPDDAHALHEFFWKPTLICSYFGDRDHADDGSLLPPIMRTPTCRATQKCRYEAGGLCLHRGHTANPQGVPYGRFESEVLGRRPEESAVL